MPGLIRGVARTAVVAGTATAVSNGVSRRQAQRWANQGPPVQSPYAVQVQQAPPPPGYYQQPPQAPPVAPPVAPPPQPPMVSAESEDDVIERLQKLAKLHAAGLVTDEEYAQKKAQLLEEL